ncbi:hypothetical protein ABK040_005627 [Willaertia magna]
MRHFNNTNTRSLESVNLLAKAPSRGFVEQVFLRVYQQRFDGFNNEFIELVAEQLQANDQLIIIEELLNTILYIIQYCVYYNFHEANQILESELFKSSSNNDENFIKLKQLMASTVEKYIDLWREQGINTQISLPKLIDMKWRVDISTASHVITKMSAPSVVVQLNVQHPSGTKQLMGPTQQVNFEMNRETLSTMLKGFGKIRDQLASIK